MTTFATTCKARHWAFDDQCRRTQAHLGFHVGEQRVWSDEYSEENLIQKIDDLVEALDDAEGTISDLEDTKDRLDDQIRDYERKVLARERTR